MNALASPKAPLSLPAPVATRLDERSRRARTEPMSVLALGDGLYEVETDGGDTYLIDLTAGRCTCPDHVFRDVRCKHLRRVAIEITEGLVPAPGEVAVDCHDCDEPVFVEEDHAGPVYCAAHRIAPGDVVADRETGATLTVVDVSDLRAGHVRVRAANTTVADYPTNEGYDADEPVVAAVYPHARVAANGPVPDALTVYCFPRTRLVKRGAGDGRSTAA